MASAALNAAWHVTEVARGRLQVINDELCYKHDTYDCIEEILVDRARLYKKVYHHRCFVP